MFSYQKLDVYQMAKEIAKKTYEITKTFPSAELYCLVSQMNRAAISIPSNIAEGSGRTSVKEKIQFLCVSYASLMELSCQAEISKDLGYIDNSTYQAFIQECKNLAIKLNNYKKYLTEK